MRLFADSDSIGLSNLYSQDATVQEIVNALENSEYAYLYNHYITLQDWSHSFMAHFDRPMHSITTLLANCYFAD